MPRPRPRSRSRFYYDPEVAAFVKSCLDQRLIYSVIRDKCVEKFGAERSPSRTAIGRYYQSLPATPEN